MWATGSDRLEVLDGGFEPDLSRSRNQQALQGVPHRACGQPPLFLIPEFTAPHFGKPVNAAMHQCCALSGESHLLALPHIFCFPRTLLYCRSAQPCFDVVSRADLLRGCTFQTSRVLVNVPLCEWEDLFSLNGTGMQYPLGPR